MEALIMINASNYHRSLEPWVITPLCDTTKYHRLRDITPISFTLKNSKILPFIFSKKNINWIYIYIYIHSKIKDTPESSSSNDRRVENIEAFGREIKFPYPEKSDQRKLNGGWKGLEVEQPRKIIIIRVPTSTAWHALQNTFDPSCVAHRVARLDAIGRDQKRLSPIHTSSIHPSIYPPTTIEHDPT